MINRREFVRKSALMGGGVAAGLGAAGGEMATVAATVRAWPAFEFEEANLAELQAAMQSGRETAASLVRAYRTQIERMDREGPQVNAVIELNPEATSIARALDRERAQGRGGARGSGGGACAARCMALGPSDEPAYREALAGSLRGARQEGIDAVMDQHQLDALVAPSGGPAHVTDYVHGGGEVGGSSSPAARAGYPSITVPAGWVKGLPVGLSFFGRAWSEPVLLRLAFAFEQATRARRPPGFLPTLG